MSESSGRRTTRSQKSSEFVELADKPKKKKTEKVVLTAEQEEEAVEYIEKSYGNDFEYLVKRNFFKKNGELGATGIKTYLEYKERQAERQRQKEAGQNDEIPSESASETATKSTASTASQSTTTSRQTRSQSAGKVLYQPTEPGYKAPDKEKLDYFTKEVTTKYLTDAEWIALMLDWGKSQLYDVNQQKPKLVGGGIYTNFLLTLFYAKKYKSQKGHLIPILKKILPLVNQLTFRKLKSGAEQEIITEQEVEGIPPLENVQASPTTGMAASPPKDYVPPTILINPDQGVFSPMRRATSAPKQFETTKTKRHRKLEATPSGETPISKRLDTEQTPEQFKNLSEKEQSTMLQFVTEMQRLNNLLQSKTVEPAKVRDKVQKTVQFITDEVEPVITIVEEVEPIITISEEASVSTGPRRSARIKAKQEIKNKVIEPILATLAEIQVSNEPQVASVKQKQLLQTHFQTLVAMTPPRILGGPTNVRFAPAISDSPGTPVPPKKIPVRQGPTTEAILAQPRQMSPVIIDLSDVSPEATSEFKVPESRMTSERVTVGTRATQSDTDLSHPVAIKEESEQTVEPEIKEYVEFPLFHPDPSDPTGELRIERFYGHDLLAIAKIIKINLEMSLSG